MRKHFVKPALRTLLQNERKALEQGDFIAVEKLLGPKIELIDKLAADPSLPKDEITEIQAILDKNQSLLRGAMGGVLAVQARMDALKQARERLRTYAENGILKSIDMKAATAMEKKA